MCRFLQNLTARREVGAAGITATTSTSVRVATTTVVVFSKFTTAEGLQQTANKSGDQNRTARKQGMNYLHEPDSNTMTMILF